MDPASPLPLPGPAWLAPVVSLVTTLGFPVIVAGLLLWFLLTRVDATMRALQAQEDARIAQVVAMHEGVVRAVEQLAVRFEHALAAHSDAIRDVARGPRPAR